MSYLYSKKDREAVLAAVPDSLWERLKGSSVLITGHRGLVGSWMVDTLKYVSSELKPKTKIHVLLGNINGSLVSSSLKTSYQYVIHAAARTNPPFDWDAINTSVNGTKNIIDLVKSRGGNECRFLYLSSGSVYGSDSFDVGRNCKIMGETICGLSRSSDFTPLIARIFTLAGPGVPLHGRYAFGNFIKNSLDGEEITVQGDGRSIRSYLYMSDLAAWLWMILLAGEGGKAYDVGSTKTVTIAELADRVAKVSKVKKVRVLGGRRDSSVYFPDPKGIVNKLAPKKLVGLDDAIKRTLAWHKQRS